MENLQRLIQKTVDNECRLSIQFDPQEYGEEWGVKFYPDSDDNAHFYAYNSDLEGASRQLLDELRGHLK